MTSILTLGRFTIHGLRDGFFHLDGGAMFGVVPKTLWERLFPADGQNRIRLGLNSILVRTPEKNILVETGIGGSAPSKYIDHYSVEREPGLLGELKKIGLGAGDIGLVINTHLHFDHCGGNTRIDSGGKAVPVFPRARYVIQRGEWEAAMDPGLRDKTSYLESTFTPLKKHGCLELVEGDTPVSAGVEVIETPGHTAHHQCVKVTSEGKTVIFLGDMVPTSEHIRPAYIMSYDLYPMDTMRNKQLTFERAAEDDWILAFNHDPSLFFGTVSREGRKFSFHPL